MRTPIIRPTSIAEYVINHAEVPIVFASKAKLNMLLTLSPQIPVTKIIVSLDPLTADHKSVLAAWAKEKDIELMEMSECESPFSDIVIE